MPSTGTGCGRLSGCATSSGIIVQMQNHFYYGLHVNPLYDIIVKEYPIIKNIKKIMFHVDIKVLLAL